MRRVLKPSGTLWLNLGDCFSHGGSGAPRDVERWPKQSRNDHVPTHAKKATGLKLKDLVGIPWMVAFALRADGWHLRSDIVWAKRNCMPESVTDRPTRSHEFVFLLSKNGSYFYDAKAIREPESDSSKQRYSYAGGDGRINVAGAYAESMRAATKNEASGDKRRIGFNERWFVGSKADRTKNPHVPGDGMRHKRSVWFLSNTPYRGAHFAVFPIALVEPCILAGSGRGDVVLDPFCGSGTTGVVARMHGRKFWGIELNGSYVEMALGRIARGR